MKPWEVLGTAEVPGSNEKVQLNRRDTEYSLTIDGYEIVNNRIHGSKDALAELACDVIEKCQEPKVLIAGLGMGFTLAAALKKLIPEAEVTVVEIVPEIVKWNREFFAEFNDNALDDKRVTVKTMDIIELLKSAEAKSYNAIILDLDNGPDELTRKENGWLYSNDGVKTLFNVLRSSGILTIWSLERKNLLTRRLNHFGFEVSEKVARARGPKSGRRHNIYFAKKPRRSKK